MYACSSIQSVLRLTFFIQTCSRKLARHLSTSSFSDKSSGATGVAADAAACADACAGDSDLDEGSWDALERIISRQVSKVVQDNFKLAADHQFQDALLVWFVPIWKAAVQMSLCHTNVSPSLVCLPLHLHIAAGHYSNSTVRRVEQNTCSNLLRPGIWRSCCCFDSMGAFTKLVDHICKSTLALHPGVRTHTHTHTHTHTCRRETGREGRRERGREGRREDNLKSCRLVCRRNVLLVNLQRRPQSPSFLRRCKKNLTQHAHAP